MAARRFTEYYLLVFKQLRQDLWRRVEWAVLAVVVASGSAFLLDALALAPKGQVLLRIVVAAVPAILVLSVYFVILAVRAPWKVLNSADARFEAELGTLLEEQQAIQNRIEAAHADTRRAMNVVQEELIAERGRNQKPDISVRIAGGMYLRAGANRDERRGDDVFRRREIYISLTLEFFNSCPQVATIDSWQLVIETSAGSRLVAKASTQQELAWARIFPARTMQPYLRVPQGETVSRCEHFVAEEEICLTRTPTLDCDGVTRETEGNLNMFDDFEVTLKVKVVDSFRNEIKTARVTGDWFAHCKV